MKNYAITVKWFSYDNEIAEKTIYRKTDKPEAALIQLKNYVLSRVSADRIICGFYQERY